MCDRTDVNGALRAIRKLTCHERRGVGWIERLAIRAWAGNIRCKMTANFRDIPHVPSCKVDQLGAELTEYSVPLLPVEAPSITGLAAIASLVPQMTVIAAPDIALLDDGPQIPEMRDPTPGKHGHACVRSPLPRLTCYPYEVH